MNNAEAKEYSTHLRELRQNLDGLIEVGLKKSHAGNGRQMSMATTSLQLVRAWMGKTLGALPGNPNPYKMGQADENDPHNTFVPPTADLSTESAEKIEADLFHPEEKLAVQRVKRLRSIINQACRKIHNLRRPLDPFAFGENGLSPFECLTQLHFHLHEASIALGYELADMLKYKRGGATGEKPTMEREDVAKAVKIPAGHKELLTDGLGHASNLLQPNGNALGKPAASMTTDSLAHKSSTPTPDSITLSEPDLSKTTAENSSPENGLKKLENGPTMPSEQPSTESAPETRSASTTTTEPASATTEAALSTESKPESTDTNFTNSSAATSDLTSATSTEPPRNSSEQSQSQAPDQAPAAATSPSDSARPTPASDDSFDNLLDETPAEVPKVTKSRRRKE